MAALADLSEAGPVEPSAWRFDKLQARRHDVGELSHTMRSSTGVFTALDGRGRALAFGRPPPFGVTFMRYVLIVVGVLCTALGYLVVTAKPPAADGAAIELRHGLLVQAGVVFLAVGLATIDIVAVLRSRSR
jgi:hypothetical protein